MWPSPQIIGTGATVEELAEAQAWIANDEPLLNAGGHWQRVAFGNSSISSPNSSQSEDDEDAENRPCRQ